MIHHHHSLLLFFFYYFVVVVVVFIIILVVALLNTPPTIIWSSICAAPASPMWLTVLDPLLHFSCGVVLLEAISRGSELFDVHDA